MHVYIVCVEYRYIEEAYATCPFATREMEWHTQTHPLPLPLCHLYHPYSKTIPYISVYLRLYFNYIRRLF